MTEVADPRVDQVEYSIWGSWWYSSGPSMVAWLTSEHRCLQCKRKFNQPWLVPTDRPWPESLEINAEIAWHWQDTHGYPVEDLEMIVSGAVNGSRGGDDG